jgi:hypothetical protein
VGGEGAGPVTRELKAVGPDIDVGVAVDRHEDIGHIAARDRCRENIDRDPVGHQEHRRAFRHGQIHVNFAEAAATPAGLAAQARLIVRQFVDAQVPDLEGNTLRRWQPAFGLSDRRYTGCRQQGERQQRDERQQRPAPTRTARMPRCHRAISPALPLASPARARRTACTLETLRPGFPVPGLPRPARYGGILSLETIQDRRRSVEL